MALRVQILPSLLAADFGRLEDGARRAEASGGDALHLDIMDGHFVPNLSMGPDVVKMARRAVRIPLSVHLMMTNPDRYAERFIHAGASSLLIHVEADCDVSATLRRIREMGARPGVVLNPDTPAERAIRLLPEANEVLCMTVFPGYGGQKFMSEVLPKIAEIRGAAVSGGFDTDILVDGGIDVDTAGLTAEQGANAMVAGTSLYREADMAGAVRLMRDRVLEALRTRWSSCL